MDKKEIRREIRARRAALTEEEWREKSSVICDRIMQTVAYQTADVIYAYLAKKGEVLLDELIQHAWKCGKQVAVPKVMGNEMDFYEITDLEQVEIGPMGIREPVSGKWIQESERCCFSSETNAVSANKSEQESRIGLMIMPAVAVDSKLHRIGYGGGYYDRYLERYPQLRKMAAAFAFQIYEEVPAEDFDIGPDCIVTEERIL